jgi:hypothetical protein
MLLRRTDDPHKDWHFHWFCPPRCFPTRKHARRHTSRRIARRSIAARVHWNPFLPYFAWKASKTPRNNILDCAKSCLWVDGKDRVEGFFVEPRSCAGCLCASGMSRHVADLITVWNVELPRLDSFLRYPKQEKGGANSDAWLLFWGYSVPFLAILFWVDWINSHQIASFRLDNSSISEYCVKFWENGKPRRYSWIIIGDKIVVWSSQLSTISCGHRVFVNPRLCKP